MIIRLLICLLFLLFFPFNAWAATHWVHPSGSSVWETCVGATDPGDNYCSYSTANSNVAAGDIVYLKGGTYTMAGGNNYDMGIAPQTTGTAGNVITYIAASGETPIFTGGTFLYGVRLYSVNYIKISGITFQDIPGGWGGISNGNYNEITGCTFTATEGHEDEGGGMGVSSGSTHNWIHGNTFSKQLSSSGACAEAVDLLRLGPASFSIGSVVPTTSNNTIEDNQFYSSAHGGIATTSSYDVIRNNIFHNEPWITGCTTGPTGKLFTYDTSATSLAVGTGSKNLTVSTGKTYTTSSTVGIISTASPQNAMSGTVSSYNSETGALVVNVTYSVGSGTIDAWTISKGNYPQYDTAGYAGKFGHRNIQIGDDFGRVGTYMMIEGNRIGHASNNPGNAGPSNLDLAAPKNIVRHNDIFNGMASGIYLKYASADLTSAITSSSSVEIGEGEKTFAIASGLHLTDGQTIRIWNTADKTKAMTGTVTSYNESTGELVVNITDTNGSGTLDAWQIFWNGASGGVNNRVYNNTIYNNGHGYDWRAYSNMGLSMNGQGIAQWNSAGTGSTANIIKNNIVYYNKEGAVCELGLNDGDSNPAQCAAENWDTVSDNYTSDPTFTDDDLTDATSLTLPDLTLQSGSGAIDGGTSLTTVHADDTGSGTSLVVTDAMYFQDGTWGSSLSNIQPDWIAVGTVTNVVQISSINYATNTITLANTITREDGQSVWLYKKSDGTRVLYGAAPDYGANEYEPVGNVRGVTASGVTIQ